MGPVVALLRNGSDALLDVAPASVSPDCIGMSRPLLRPGPPERPPVSLVVLPRA
jgi:hypothetical protein